MVRTQPHSAPVVDPRCAIGEDRVSLGKERTTKASERRAGTDGRRLDGRQRNETRLVRIQPGFLAYAEGSVLIEMGNTRVVCAASVEEKVPSFLVGTGRGWVTAEYGMLPRATHTRNEREARRGRLGGRTHEIQRLIGRSLRAVVDMRALGERTVWIDCDVLQADGGTRTAAITGGYVALAQALFSLRQRGLVGAQALVDSVAAVSAGIVEGRAIVDLTYEEDQRADVDMNFVMTGRGRFVEIQGTAEGRTFTQRDLGRLIELASGAIKELVACQRRAVSEWLR